MSIVQKYQQPEVTLTQMDSLLHGFRYTQGTVSIKEVRAVPEFQRDSPGKAPIVPFFCPSWVAEVKVEEKKRGKEKGRRAFKRAISQNSIPIYTEGFETLWDRPGIVNLENLEFIIDHRGLLLRVGPDTVSTVEPLVDNWSSNCRCPQCRPDLYQGWTPISGAGQYRQTIRGGGGFGSINLRELLEGPPPRRYQPLLGGTDLTQILANFESMEQSMVRFREFVARSSESLRAMFERELNS